MSAEDFQLRDEEERDNLFIKRDFLKKYTINPVQEYMMKVKIINFFPENISIFYREVMLF